jgi:hypothetical protein
LPRKEDIMKVIKKTSQHPKFIYENKDDVLNIFLSKKPIDCAEQSGDMIVHFSKDDEPVYLEILDASRFLKRQGEDLPKDIKQKFFAN